MELLTPQITQFLYVSLAIRLIVWILFARTVNGLLKNIREENQFMQPKQAWLLAIPFVNVYYNFVVARAIANSLNNEFFDRKIAEEENPGLSAGMVFATMTLLSHLAFLPMFLLMTFGLLSIIYFIRYWLKVHNFKILIDEHNRFLEGK